MIKESKWIESSIMLILFSLMLLMTLSINVSARNSENEELSGVELWSQNCMRCHNTRNVDEFNDAQWDIIMTHMRVVANLPGKQARKINEYLQKTNNPPQEYVEVKMTEEKIASNGDASMGKKVFKSNCATCHGITGKGDGPASASLTPKPRDLTDTQFMSDKSDEYLYRAISQGGGAVGKSPAMPAFGSMLSKQDIENLISYIRSLSQK